MTPRTEQPHEGRLGQALAWVGIIAGIVFVVAVVFFSGLAMGWYANARRDHFDRPPTIRHRVKRPAHVP